MDRTIVDKLMRMLDDVNPLLKQFRQARDRIRDCPNQRVAIRILSAQSKVMSSTIPSFISDRYALVSEFMMLWFYEQKMPMYEK